MRSAARSSAAASIFVFLSACSPSSYRLERDALVPPGVRNAAVRQARVNSEGASTRCTPAAPEHGVTSTLKGRRLRMDAARDELRQAPAGWASGWASRLEAAGCLPPGQAGAVADRLAFSLPLPANVAHRLTHTEAAASGYVDLRPGYRIRITSPILRPGAVPSAPAVVAVRESAGGLTVDVKASPDLLGYEIAWYDVTPAGLRPAGAEAHLAEGKVEKSAASRFDNFRFPAAAPLLRSLVLTRRSAQDRDSLLLAAASASELDAQTAALNQDPSRCRGERCAVLPLQVALTAFIVVRVNGEEKLLAPGSTVRAATGGRLPVRLWKPFHGRLAPVVLAGGDVLAIPLAGGERLEL